MYVLLQNSYKMHIIQLGVELAQTEELLWNWCLTCRLWAGGESDYGLQLSCALATCNVIPVSF